MYFIINTENECGLATGTVSMQSIYPAEFWDPELLNA